MGYCRFTIAKKIVVARKLNIFLQKNSPLTDVINKQYLLTVTPFLESMPLFLISIFCAWRLTFIQQTGMFDRLAKKLIPSAEFCLKDDTENTHLNNKRAILELHHMQPVFIALACTLTVITVISIGQIGWHRYQIKLQKKWILGSANLAKVTEIYLLLILSYLIIGFIALLSGMML